MLSSLLNSDEFVPALIIATLFVSAEALIAYIFLRKFARPSSTHFTMKREALSSPWASRHLSRYEDSRKNLADRWPSITNLDPFKKASTMVQGDLAIRPETLEMPCVLHHMVYTGPNQEVVGQMIFTPSVKRGECVSKGEHLGDLKMYCDGGGVREVKVISPIDGHVFDFIENISGNVLNGEVVTLLERGKEMTILHSMDQYLLSCREVDDIKKKVPSIPYPPGRLIFLKDGMEGVTIKVMASPLHTEKDKIAWIFRSNDDIVSAVIESGGKSFYVLLAKMDEPRAVTPDSGLIRSSTDGSFLALSTHVDDFRLALSAGTPITPLRIVLQGTGYSQDGVCVIADSQAYRLIDVDESDKDLEQHRLIPAGKDLS